MAGWRRGLEWEDQIARRRKGGVKEPLQEGTYKIKGHLRGCMGIQYSIYFLWHIHIWTWFKWNYLISGWQSLNWLSVVTKWSFHCQDWDTSSWCVGRRGPMRTLKQPRLLTVLYKLMVRSHCWRRHLHDSLRMEELSCWCLPRAVTVLEGTLHATKGERQTSTQVPAYKTPRCNRGRIFVVVTEQHQDGFKAHSQTLIGWPGTWDYTH